MLRAVLRTVVPRAARLALHDARRALGARRWRGTGAYCPVCEHEYARFLPFGDVVRREHALCPGCHSLERHRLLWRYLHERTELFSRPHRLLHFAPERCLERRLGRAPTVDYVTADLQRGRAMLQLDITRQALPDASFDAVLAVDVLEHIEDDRAALRELRRVLRPGGWALLRVPLDTTRAETLQDPAIRTPEDRAREYWHPDHLRLYGRDFPDRLREAGFTVREDDFAFHLAPDQTRRQGIVPETIYLSFR
ncbi:MAG TPA: methyltransferase domain-containing protein [Longimicrobium sp.]|nr:methyltransferase domain-containing protein [Longimicrobium sp.]